LVHSRIRVPRTNPPAASPDEAQRGDAIVLSDSSVEAEDVAVILRLRGFTLFDVPLSLLESRVLSEEPRVVVVDIDQAGAVDKIKRLRETFAGKRAEIFCLGDPLRAAELQDVSLSSNVFERPLDVQRLVDRISHVAGPAGGDFSSRGTTPPPMLLQRASSPPAADSIPPISDFPRAEDPLEVGLAESADGGISAGLASSSIRLSPELAAAMAAAEERVRSQLLEQGSLPVAADDGDCLLPPDLLLQLDEPLDAADELEGTGGIGNALPSLGAPSGTGSLVALTPLPRGTGVTPAPNEATRYPSEPGPRPSLDYSAEIAGLSTANPATRSGTPALGVRVADLLGIRVDEVRRGAPIRPHTEVAPHAVSGAKLIVPPTPLGVSALTNLAVPQVVPAFPQVAPTISPPVRFQEQRSFGSGRSVSGFHGVMPSESEEPAQIVRPEEFLRPLSPVEAPRASEQVRPQEGISPAAHSVRADVSQAAVFGPHEGLRPLAQAIVSRQTGAVSLTTDQGVRTVLFSDGDIVTASSDVAEESLVAFLAMRGELSREAAERLAGRLPPSGRHAGAALIAQSHLAQNDLWPVLRAHAEWLIGRALVSGPGSVLVEPEVPTRLRSEPSVFGGATGAEVFVEAARRVLSPERCIALMGGARARFDRGKQHGILSECALPEDEEALVRGASGRLLEELLSESPQAASVLFALIELGVLVAIAPASSLKVAGVAPFDPLDDEAIRAKVRAKLTLVREGDYFALLGIQREATSYEVKRAYLDLRRTFEPSRLLTPQTRDLYTDVTLIVEVVEEAFEVLRDAPRRARYRRAIEAGPPE
jgi:hypothetical protein